MHYFYGTLYNELIFLSKATATCKMLNVKKNPFMSIYMTYTLSIGSTNCDFVNLDVIAATTAGIPVNATNVITDKK